MNILLSGGHALRQIGHDGHFLARHPALAALAMAAAVILCAEILTRIFKAVKPASHRARTVMSLKFLLLFPDEPFQKMILVPEMLIKCGAADFRLIADFLHGQL